MILSKRLIFSTCAVLSSSYLFTFDGRKRHLYCENPQSSQKKMFSLLLEQDSKVAADVRTTKNWHFYKGPIREEAAKGLKLFKCNDQPIADEIASYLGVPLNNMKVTNFADGETSIDIQDGVRGKRVYIVCSTTSVDRLLELLLAISAMRRASAKSIVAIIPYYGYGRQDRMVRMRESIAAADIARMLEIMGVDHVVTVNLHSPQIQGFFHTSVDDCCAFPVGALFFSEQGLENPVVVSPHSSTVPSASAFREALCRYRNENDIPIAIAVKKDYLGQRRPGELIGSVRGKDCIVVDTLVDTGLTLSEIARLLKKNGARKVYAFSVHGRFTMNAVETLLKTEELDMCVVTNTVSNKIPPLNGKIIQLNIAPLLSEAIKSIHTRASLEQIAAQ